MVSRVTPTTTPRPAAVPAPPSPDIGVIAELTAQNSKLIAMLDTQHNRMLALLERMVQNATPGAASPDAAAPATPAAPANVTAPATPVAPASPVATGAQMSSARAPVVSGNTAATTGGGESCWCVATFDFTPTNDDELELKKGASVRVLERGSREGGDEWWRGSSGVQDVEGLFPANRVRVLSRDAARAAGLADGPMPTPSARLLSPASASAQFSFDAFDGAGKGGAGDAFDFFGGGATSGSTTGF